MMMVLLLLRRRRPPARLPCRSVVALLARRAPRLLLLRFFFSLPAAAGGRINPPPPLSVVPGPRTSCALQAVLCSSLLRIEGAAACLAAARQQSFALQLLLWVDWRHQRPRVPPHNQPVGAVGHVRRKARQPGDAAERHTRDNAAATSTLGPSQALLGVDAERLEEA